MGKTSRHLIKRWRGVECSESSEKTTTFNPVLVCQFVGAGVTAMVGYSTGFSFVPGSIMVGATLQTVWALA